MVTSPRQDSAYHTYFRDQSWIFVSHLLIYARGVILLPILIKNLGVELYGQYILLMITGDLLFGISSFGVGYRFRRFMPSAQDPGERRNLFFQQFYLHLFFIAAICSLVTAGHHLIAPLHPPGGLPYSVSLFCALIVANFLFAKLTDYIRYTDRQRRLAVILSLNPYLAIGFIVLFLLTLDHVEINHLLMASIAAMTLLSLPLVLQVVSELGLRLPRYELDGIVADIRTGFPLVLAYVVDFVLSSSDRYLIAFFLSSASVGLYNPAYTLGSLIILVPKALGIALPPALARAIDNGRESEAETLVRHSIRGYLVVAIPFVVGGALLGRPLLELLANAEVADGAHRLVAVIALGILFYGINSILINVLFVKGETALIFKVTLFSAILNLGLNTVLLYHFREIMIPALTTLFSYFVALVITGRKVRSLFRVRGEPLIWVRILLSALAMGALIELLLRTLGHSDFVILFTVLCAIFFYLYCILVLKVYSLDELRALATTLR